MLKKLLDYKAMLTTLRRLIKLCGYFSREVIFDTLSNRRKSVPSFSPLPYSWLPLGQGRNNKMAYSLNLQTPSLP